MSKTRREKASQQEEVTAEARGYLERAAELEASVAVLKAQATLGDSAAEWRLTTIGREVAELRAKAESVLTPERLAAVRKRNEEAAREQEEAAYKARMGALVLEELQRVRLAEYSRLGLTPALRSGRVELPLEHVVDAANRAEDLIGDMAVAGDDIHRQQWLMQNLARELLTMSFDEACEQFLGASARFCRSVAVDRFLSIHITEDGQLVPGAPEEALVESPTASPEGVEPWRGPLTAG